MTAHWLKINISVYHIYVLSNVTSEVVETLQ